MTFLQNQIIPCYPVGPHPKVHTQLSPPLWAPVPVVHPDSQACWLLVASDLREVGMLSPLSRGGPGAG